jgi:hypothetical protein
MEINRESFEIKYFNHQLRILIKDLKQIDIKRLKKRAAKKGDLVARLLKERR